MADALLDERRELTEPGHPVRSLSPTWLVLTVIFVVGLLVKLLLRRRRRLTPWRVPGD